MTALRIVSPDCGEEYPLESREWVCIRCGGSLEVVGTPDFDPGLIDYSVQSLWRYRALLPLPESTSPVTMGEGWTPLVPAERRKDVLFKLDFMMPTGSFKDRGSTVLASALRGLDVKDIVEDSSGNAAASLSAYAARAGIHAEIYVPEHASAPKLAQIRVYGATLRMVQGPRENSAHAAQEAVIHGSAYYASHYHNPFALFGMQTTAWELWEQMGGRAPDNIILPVGHGTNFVGMYRGFGALLRCGLIERLPRFFAAQAAKVAPLAVAFAEGKPEPEAVEPARTIAEGIAISRPARGTEILRAIRETGGAAIAVAEEEILAARSGLAHEGIYVEPTSATAVAALEKITALPGTIVVSLTGSGLKSP